jgi:D-serine deaminase-like pyridoxal phosphate-dependent protein
MRRNGRVLRKVTGVAARDYEYYRQAIGERPMPLAFIDLDLFDENVRAVAARAGDKKIRIATKSIRCVPLIERVFGAHPNYRGVMAFSVREAVFLSQQGLDDLLVGYPEARGAQDMALAEELRRGKTIVLMVDCQEHVDLLEAFGRAYDVEVPVCLDLDMSSRLYGLHFGVRRSPIATPEQAGQLCAHVKRCTRVRLDGLMGYEAQIAGLPDHVRGAALRNWFTRALKRQSLNDTRDRRSLAVREIGKQGHALRFANGGGTGSLETTIQDPAVTEVTAGSGFFSPHLFDSYRAFRHQPAAGYAVEIVRIPTPGIYTCLGGGYVASGVGADKQPKPYLPEGARLLPQEGAGEVQTPMRYDGPLKLSIGDPIFMRYSKAGEMCERFNFLAAISNGEVVGELPTYRGEGQAFL